MRSVGCIPCDCGLRMWAGGAWCSEEGLGFGVDGAALTFTTTEASFLLGTSAAARGYTTIPTFVSNLTLLNHATGSSYSLPTPAPHSLVPGQVRQVKTLEWHCTDIEQQNNGISLKVAVVSYDLKCAPMSCG